MTVDVMLTTIDNPFNPFTQFDEWYNFDESKGYCSCGLIERIVMSSDAFTQEQEDAAILAAIDEIVQYNVLGVHRKVTPTDFQVS